jgi:hypothetical protein
MVVEAFTVEVGVAFWAATAVHLTLLAMAATGQMQATLPVGVGVLAAMEREAK